MSFDGEIAKRALWLMSYLNDFQWRIDDHLFIISGIDQQTYGTSWRNYGWLMSRSGGPLLSATFVKSFNDPAPGNSGNGKQFHNESGYEEFHDSHVTIQKKDEI